jgi:hypothetical protein
MALHRAARIRKVSKPVSQPGTAASVDTEHFLRDHMAQAVTGCISVQGRAGRLRVYLMQGEIIAAHSPDDAHQVLDRLVAAGALDAQEAARLGAANRSAGGLVQALVGRVDDALLDARLAARFRQALLEFLRADAPPGFQSMDAVFVDNIQMGHDSASLLDDLTHQQGRLDTLRSRPDLRLAAGPTPANSPVHQQLARLCATGRTLRDLVAASPFEELETLGFVLDMLAIEALVPVAAPAPAAPPASPPGPRQLGGGLSTSGDTDPGDDGGPDHTEEVSIDADAPSPRLPPPRGRGAPPGFAPPSGLLDDSILAMFQDHDQTRGMGSGDFSTDRALLDRVEVEDKVELPVGPDGGERVVIEMEEADEAASARAVSLNFGGPRLAEADARNKVAVANDVLAAVSFALDEHAGFGAGRIAIQLLLEGAPNQYAVLFQNAEADKMGRVNAEAVLRNLARRPESEHRQLLNLALADLIERALSSCLEELPEDAIDAMLEHIAGYQQRLGL